MTVRRSLVTAVVFFVCLAVGICFIELQPKVYTATTKIQLRSIATLGSIEDSYDRTNFQSEFEIMQSANVLLPIIRDLGLDHAWAGRIYHRTDDLSPAEAIAYLRKMLKLKYDRETKIIDIIVESDNPTEAANIVNAIADRYKTMRDVEEEQQTRLALNSLREQIRQQEQVVSDKKAALDKINDKLSDEYEVATRVWERAKSILDSLNSNLKQVTADQALMQSPVRILSRAEAPPSPTRPNRPLWFSITAIISALEHFKV